MAATSATTLADNNFEIRRLSSLHSDNSSEAASHNYYLPCKHVSWTPVSSWEGCSQRGRAARLAADSAASLMARSRLLRASAMTAPARAS